jgi:hypothetical protein
MHSLRPSRSDRKKKEGDWTDCITRDPNRGSRDDRALGSDKPLLLLLWNRV